jgi:hypothetical protein
MCVDAVVPKIMQFANTYKKIDFFEIKNKQILGNVNA